ncbi:MAG: dipicolinate synthase subunit B [Velocimicrobium sp.]
MTLNSKEIGFAMTGSFCTFSLIFKELERIVATGANVTPIFSNAVQHINCRFGNSNEFYETAKKITGHTPILTLETAEPIGPKSLLDLLIIAPCTGNSLAKLSLAITDSPVLMAAKAHLRNNKPVVIFLSTNDGLSMNLKNIGALLNSKNIYFVPFTQDNPIKKPNSLVSEASLILETAQLALESTQLQPILLPPK